jgi:hypothetical protein
VRSPDEAQRNPPTGSDEKEGEYRFAIPPYAFQLLVPIFPARSAGVRAGSCGDIVAALYLIRSTLLTLNDANRSGNYTVLRDLAAPDFQARNTATDLSQIFSDLRRRNFDLYGTALLAPQLTAVPALDQRGFLDLAGYFSTQPQQINFDLLFQVIANQWRLYGISVSTPQTPSAGR